MYFRLPTLLWVFTSGSLRKVILWEGCLHSNLSAVIYKAKTQIHLEAPVYSFSLLFFFSFLPFFGGCFLQLQAAWAAPAAWLAERGDPERWHSLQHYSRDGIH